MATTRARLVLSVLFVAAASSATGASSGGERPVCFGRRATIVGTAYNDRVTDTPRADVIVTLGGRDVVDAVQDDLDEPRDRICTGNGRDHIEGGTGWVDGGRRRDVIEGAAGRVFGERGNDRLSPAYRNVFGGPGDDYIYGSGRLIGGPGSDDITGETAGAYDTLVGGPGNDRFTTFESGALVGSYDYVSYKNAPRRIRVNIRTGVIRGWGRDRVLGPDALNITGSRFRDRFIGGQAVRAGLHGFKGDDVFIGSRFDDAFSGDAGADHLDARRGHDFLEGGAGNDVILGGGGNQDLASFLGRGPVRVDLTKRSATGQGRDVVRGVERAWGSLDDDHLLGTRGANYLWGNRGSDVIKGRRGNDEIQGFRGRDERLFGNLGDDQIWAPDVGDGSGWDTTSLVDGGAGRDACAGGRQRSCESQM